MGEASVQRHTIRKAALSAMRLTGLSRLLRGVAAGSGAILTFHRVREPDERSFSPNAHLEVTPGFLARLVDWLNESGIDIVSLDEAMRRLATGTDHRFIVLTFDDGFRDNHAMAWPILQDRRAPFTIYVATGFIDRTAIPWWMVLEEAIVAASAIDHPGGSGILPARTTDEKQSAFSQLAAWLDSVPEHGVQAAARALAEQHGVDADALTAAAFMDWDELAEIAADPLVTIGSHTHNHLAVAKLSPDEVREEVGHANATLARRLGRPPRHFSYPYGFPAAVGERDYGILADMGMTTAVLTSPGVLRSETLATPTALPRISMNGHFQKLRYAETLLSGVPFWPGSVVRRLRGMRPPVPVKPTASASSG